MYIYIYIYIYIYVYMDFFLIQCTYGIIPLHNDNGPRLYDNFHL